jgi:hypothetical protein
MIQSLVSQARFASRANREEFFLKFPMLTKAITHIPGNPASNEEKLHALHRVRGIYIERVLADGFRECDAELAAGTLPDSCILRMVAAPSSVEVVSGIPTPRRENALERIGSQWRVWFDGRDCMLDDTRAIQYVAYLIRHSGQSFTALELVSTFSARSTDRRKSLENALEHSDSTAVSSEPQRGIPVSDAEELKDLRRELAQARHDFERASAAADDFMVADASRDIAALESEIRSRLEDLRRSRRQGSAAEAARKSVVENLRVFMSQRLRDCPQFRAHLVNHLKFGSENVYRPPTGAGHWGIVSDPLN